MHYRKCPNCKKISYKLKKQYQYLYMVEIYQCPKCTLRWHRELPFGDVGIQFFIHVGGKGCKCVACVPENIVKKLDEISLILHPDETG